VHQSTKLKLIYQYSSPIIVIVIPLYDRLLGLTLGLTQVAHHHPSIAQNCETYLHAWVACALRLRQQLHLLNDPPAEKLEPQWIANVVVDQWKTGDRSNLERIFALALGGFCWCDHNDVWSIWRNSLSVDCSAEIQTSIELFTIVLRSFLREPPGRTVWLPLKRATTIADLHAFSPHALAELQRTQNTMSRNTTDLFLTSTAIACQLPWYSSASKLARRQTQSPESLAIIGVLLGAAFGPIAFQEEVRVFQSTYDAQRIAADAIAPLWQLWTGSGGGQLVKTVSIARAISVG